MAVLIAHKNDHDFFFPSILTVFVSVVTLTTKLKALTAEGADAISVRGGAEEKKGGLDIGLIVYFALWYLGNYYVSLEN